MFSITDIPRYDAYFFINPTISIPYIPKKEEQSLPIGYFVDGYSSAQFVIDEFSFINNPYDIALSKIEEFISLNQNWDGYDAIPVTSETGHNSKKFLDWLTDLQIEKISDIFPNSHGTITFEWENNNEEKLSLEIGDKNYSYFATYLNKNPKLIDGKDFFSDIREITSEIDNVVRE